MQVGASQLLPWIVLLPFLGAFVNGLLFLTGVKVRRSTVALIGVGSVAAAFMLSLRCFYSLHALSAESNFDPAISKTVYTWAVSGMFQFDVAFYLDPLSAVMLLIVTGVGLMIHIYSVGYMSEEPSVGRYFAYLNLFMFSMLCLILGKNLLMLFVGWEGVGVCSYLLIGFWFTDDQKAQAGQKAFVVNRIGDFGFIIGMILLLYHADGTTDYEVLKWRFESTPWGPFYDPVTLIVACLLLFLGACGKSAQIPLYVWLPDAMAGPTPVSALIHAATMVTAGVYMIARLGFMFSLAPIAMEVVATVGALTALFAALMALTQRDIKGVLAYSTVSQLGYMILAVGVGAYVAGVFHLMTHAFFKALLFLAAGSVIHGMAGKQDIWEMGGLKAKMPQTRITFLIATLAIAGFPYLSGFYSKDAILWEVYSRQQMLQVPDQTRAAFSDGNTMIIGGRQGVLLVNDGEGSWEFGNLPPTDVKRGSATQKVLPAVRGVTVDPDGTAWAVTEYASIYRRTDGTWERAWQAGPELMSRHFNAVWAASGSEIWFVGDRGLIVRSDGTNFVVHDSGTLSTLKAVAGAGGAVYAGGSGGTMLKFDGAGWTTAITGLLSHGGTVWGTTAQGAILKVGAGGFEKVKADVKGGSIAQLTSLASAGDDLVFGGSGAVDGDTLQPIVVRKTGASWAIAGGAAGPTIHAIGSVGGDVFAAGTGGKVLVPGADGLEARTALPSDPGFGWLWVLALITAGLTAFYMFRLYFITFEGETRADKHTWDHAHESPWVMTIPLWVLAFLSIVGGWFWHERVVEWLEPVVRVRVAPHDLDGIGKTPQRLAEAARPLYLLSRNKFYVDELYHAVVITPYRFVSDVLHRVVDVKIIDFGLTGLSAMIVKAGGSVLRLFQNGNVQRYAVGVVVGLAGVIWLMGM